MVPWKISRERAEQLLSPPFDGMFLVRESTNFPGDYTLCVSFAGKVEHYHIIYRNNLLTIDEEEMFDTLAKLVEVILYRYYHGHFRFLVGDSIYLKSSLVVLHSTINATPMACVPS